MDHVWIVRVENQKGYKMVVEFSFESAAYDFAKHMRELEFSFMIEVDVREAEYTRLVI